MIITRRNINDFLVFSRSHQNHQWSDQLYNIYFTSADIFNQMNMEDFNVDIDTRYAERLYKNHASEDTPNCITVVIGVPRRRRYGKIFHVEKRLIEEYVNVAMKVSSEFIYKTYKSFNNWWDEKEKRCKISVDLFYYNVKTKESYLPNEIKFSI